MRSSLWCLWLVLLALPALADPAYQAKLEQVARLLQQAERTPKQAAPLVRQAQQLVPAGYCPTLQRAAQQATPATVTRARREVEALRRAAILTPSAQSSGGAPSQVLKGVLARGEFQSLQKSKWPTVKKPSWWDKMWAAIGRAFTGFLRMLGRFFGWFASLFRRMLPTMPAPSGAPGWMKALGPHTKAILYSLLIAAVIALLGFLLSRLLAAWHRRELRAATADEIPDDPVARRRQEPTLWERAMAQVEALWAQGNEREALRILYRACLVLLDARGVLRYDESRANGEVLRELRRQGRATVQAQLRPIVHGFDRSWYGSLPVSQEEFTALREEVRTFRATVMGETV